MSPKSRMIRFFVIFSIILVIVLGATIYIKIKYEITSISVTGNEHYTEEEIRNIVFDKPYTYNSIILKIKYSNKSIENVPFIERIDVDIVNPTTVRINVYEKAVAGYVEYLGHFMYFDKDGIVVESSTDMISGVPYVTGLSYDHVVLHDELPVKDKSVFILILNITQLLTKYEIETDRIAFDSNGKVTLYFGDARVSLGDDSYIDEKINEMHLLLPKLEGRKGTLHMESYSGDESTFSFDIDDELVVEEDESAEEAEAEESDSTEDTE